MEHQHRYRSIPELEKYLRCYISVCNHVLAENESKFPFSQIWRASEQELFGRPINFKIEHNNVEVACSVVFDKCRIQSIPESGNIQPYVRIKKYDLAYILSVLQEPYKYIQDPVLIDWDWMYAGTHHFSPKKQSWH